MHKFIIQLIIAINIFFMAGCATEPLPESWRPLTTLIERGDLPGIGDSVITTITPNLFVKDKKLFDKMYPKDSPWYEALRRHEVQHAKEQEEFIGDAKGVKRKVKLAKWVKRYLTDRKFRWEVEKRGYKKAIVYLRTHGVLIPAERYAATLSGRSYNYMVSYQEALQWVLKVYQGQA